MSSYGARKLPTFTVPQSASMPTNVSRPARAPPPASAVMLDSICQIATSPRPSGSAPLIPKREVFEETRWIAGASPSGFFASMRSSVRLRRPYRSVVCASAAGLAMTNASTSIGGTSAGGMSAIRASRRIASDTKRSRNDRRDAPATSSAPFRDLRGRTMRSDEPEMKRASEDARRIAVPGRVAGCPVSAVLIPRCLEQVIDAHDEAVELHAVRSRRVRVDVVVVGGIRIVVEEMVPDVRDRALGKRVGVADRELIRSGIVTAGKTRDARAAALAVFRVAIERVDRARADRRCHRNAVEVALEASGRRVVIEALVDAGEPKEAEVPRGRRRQRLVIQARRANVLVPIEEDTALERAVVVDAAKRQHERIGGTVFAVQRDLRAADEARDVRRVVAERVAQARIEAARRLRGRALRPDRRGRQDRRGERRHVTEDRVRVVVRGQEVAYEHRYPRALQPDERVATGQRAAAGVAGDRRLELEDRVQPAAQRFGSAHAKARRVRAKARNARTVPV